MMQLKYIFLRFGLFVSFEIIEDNNMYSMSISENDYNNCFICDTKVNENENENENGLLWTTIENIENIQYSGNVYDFNMYDNHNYLTDMGIVHNSGKRNGSFAIYLEPWHADVEDFLELKKNHGDEDSKSRDLFYALWVCDLFMERTEKNQDWSLFCPNECPGLSDAYGDAFTELYNKYETQGLAKRVVKARELWFKILDAQMETGTPYILYKDACNIKSNQQNIGTIKSSNLCTEIIQYSDSNETAVCNLASIALPTFVNPQTKQFDFETLHSVTKVVTNNLNKVIDVNFYPTEKTQTSNMRHRPVGIGVQGLADTFVLMDLAFQSDLAKEVNKMIFETIYHAALEKSCEISQNICEYIKQTSKETMNDDSLMGAYSSFKGSPASKGILQFDMWGKLPSNRYDWNSLKNNIMKHGLRNSLLVAPMPTASTSQILGFNECFEPFTSNLYTRRTLAGEFIVINKYLIKELIQLGHWNEEIKNSIIVNKGSIQHFTFLPEHTRNKFKIVWEMPMKYLIDLAADRGAYICQSQSLNLWIEDPNYNVLTSMHFYSWKKGLKTGIYYLRRKAKHQAQQFTIEPEQHDNIHEENEVDYVCENCSA
jgi:ribonucleoside-diphosphate reductase alpha subunit